MRRYHQERTIIRRHHREHLRGQRGAPSQVAEVPRGCFRKRHAPPLHGARCPGSRDRQEWQGERALQEGADELWRDRPC